MHHERAYAINLQVNISSARSLRSARSRLEESLTSGGSAGLKVLERLRKLKGLQESNSGSLSGQVFLGLKS